MSGEREREREREREGERERERRGREGERENVCDVVMCCFFVPNNIVATHNRSGFVLGLSVCVSMVKYHPYTTPGDCLDKCHVCR
jgi:hypothetical protein